MSEKLKNIRVGLDIDGALSCFSCGVLKRARELKMESSFPVSCDKIDCWNMSDSFSSLMKDVWTDDKFWLNLPVLEGVLPLEFKPVAYITSRFVPSSVTKQWLKNNGFPDAPVITVKHPKEKLAHVKKLKLDLYVDDLYKTVRELRDNGINALLMEAPYQVGHAEDCKGLPTIKSLKEIENYI